MYQHTRRAMLALSMSAGLALGGIVPAVAEEPAVRSIEEVQGSTDTSPYAGQQVAVRGVVTGAYAEGGIRGFYLQSAGSGARLSPVGSSGIFVYAPQQVSQVAVGDHLQVSGTVSEYYGLTQISAASVSQRSEPAAAVKPLDLSIPASDAQRERFESMLIEPQGRFTVADNYALNQYGEVSLAQGTSRILRGEKTLRQPTDAFAPGSAKALQLAEENKARAIVLDDGATLNFSTAANTSVPLPYLDEQRRVSVGANATFTAPVIMDYRYDLWRLQPTGQVTGSRDADSPVKFEQLKNSRPSDVGGTVKVGSFNVLNYFTTTGDSLQGCTYYNDREGQPVTVRGGCDARGAATAASLERQEEKIVAALNKFDADVVVLEEIENSAHFGQHRDAALAHLVKELNAAAGRKTWDFVPSPRAVPEGEDVIRTAMIYQRDAVKPIGASQILDDPAFDNARDPLAQSFQRSGGNQKTRFLVIANHFKSKGSDPADGSANADQGDGQGAWNASRVEQATALVRFADSLKKSANTKYVLLAGDFNSYSAEEPVKVLQEAGYVDLGAKADSRSYLFDGLTGSLDHIFASKPLAAKVAGQDIWNINATESIGYEYSRYNYNVTQLVTGTHYRSSDHDPVLVGLRLDKR